jgi:hypothetical protein
MRMTASARTMWLVVGLSCLMVLPAQGASTADLISQPGPTFTIAVPMGAWSVIAYGDMRFTDPHNMSDTNPQARRALVARIAAEKPSALLLSGDVPLNGGVENDYKVFRDETAAWRDQGLRVFPAMGNHELHGNGGVENWWNTFPELKGRRWYSVEFGEAYFITLDSNLDLRAGGTQSAWLAKQLDGLPKGTKYVFISLHHPPVADPIAFNPTHDVRSNEKTLAEQLEAAAKQMSAKIIVIAGHIHAYQRFERAGIVYLVSGGGGAAQHHISRSRQDLYQDNTFPNFHYIKFTSEQGALKATMYQLNARGDFDAKDNFVVTSAKSAAQ